MNTYSLSIKQYTFLRWVNRNYEWLKSKGFSHKWQPFQHNVHRIMVSSTYTDEDKEQIDNLIRFIKGLGISTYNRDWTWDKNGAQLDWIVNLRNDGTMFNSSSYEAVMEL